ncbi:TIM-barrel domain-containing protein [Herpetosiphon llansteffanensis]|uniref:TIM-barrel domain-containing protein n=1 Tax=Herpetosiphon llansteffanensis TaxID=2094568 RepID=UPI000D7BC3BA|nr:glycoside hydrolase family 31 protein [Herpetosiphon llansteffanensis]
MTYTLESTGLLVFQRDDEEVLTIQPYLAQYGSQFAAMGVQTQPDTVQYTSFDNQTFELNLETTATGYRLVFHVKHQVAQIGLAIGIQPAGSWYGMGERVIQSWPLNLAGVQSQPLITYDHADDGTLNIVTPVWIGANGVAFMVAEDTGPLHVTIDSDPAGVIRLLQFPSPTPFGAGLDGSEIHYAGTRLVLDLVIAENVSLAAQHIIQKLGHPTAAPPLAMFSKPIWTTWARYKMDIDQVQTLAFAQEIIDQQYPYSVLEIDDRWQTAYGDLEFDLRKFPDPKAMVDQLHQLGYKVTLWIPPFFDPKSAAFAEAAANGYLVKHPGNDQPYLTRWWQGWGGLLDVSNPAALAWWQAGLDRLQILYGIDGFKFDGAEGNFLPAEAKTHLPMTPNQYSDRYVAFVAQSWQWTEVRTGWRSQQQPIFFREWDKWSRWGMDNGLHAVVTQALAMSVIGYPYVLPDMIGGNAYNGEFPERELLIRWTQVTALLPAMQFSIAPWQYDAETSQICQRYAQLHAELEPYIAELLQATTTDGTPLVRPLWWHYPDDASTRFIGDQWLFGEQYLAAPILQANRYQRDIYLPEGGWRDYWTGEKFDGETWLYNYPAPLETMPLFERLW